MSTSPVSLGIDASWSNTGMVSIGFDEDFGEVLREHCVPSSPKPGVSAYERLDAIGVQILEFVQLVKPTTILLEGYAHGAKFGREKMGELGGHIKWLLWREGLNPIIVPPTTLKSFVCDSGSAKKEAMMMHTLRRWGYEAANNDLCDAYGLSRLGLELLKTTKAAEAMRKKCESVAEESSGAKRPRNEPAAIGGGLLDGSATVNVATPKGKRAKPKA
jgi:Holliday junction resolvasome RuvABC endonuclease subunit